MAFARFADETLVAEGMSQLGISYAFLAAVTEDGPCASAVNLWLNGIHRLDPAKSRALVLVIRDLQAIAKEHEPYRLEMKNAAEWRALLTAWRAAQRQAGAQALGDAERV